MITSPDGRYALTTDTGYHEALWSIRTADGKGAGHVEFPNTRLEKVSNGLYYGLAIAGNVVVRRWRAACALCEPTRHEAVQATGAARLTIARAAGSPRVSARSREPT